MTRVQLTINGTTRWIGSLQFEYFNPVNKSEEREQDTSENMTINVGKDFNMTVGGESNHSLTAAKKLNIHTDADAEIDADGQMTVDSQKNMYIKSKVKLDIAKG